MRPNPHVPRLYGSQALEEIERRDSLVQHAAKVLSSKPKEPEHAQLHP